MRVLGVFPRLDLLGGIEAVGRLAVEAFPAAGIPMETLCVDGSSRSGKLGALASAVRSGAGADTALVWHMGLAKLLPLLRTRPEKVFVFLHGIECWQPLPWLERRLLSRARCLLTNSDHTWTRFVEANPGFSRHEHRTVNLGLDLAGAPGLVTDAPPAALIVGRMQRSEDYKGHRELVEAWPLVRRSVPDAELWIAGEGDLRPELEAKATPGVRFFGRVSEQEKARLIHQSRCFAMPSRGEGFGLVYLEAMSAGRPCLVSTRDAGREVVQPPRAGLAVDPFDRPALADTLRRLLTPGEEWNQWSRHALSLYRERFTAPKFQQRLVEAVRSAA